MTELACETIVARHAQSCMPERCQIGYVAEDDQCDQH